MFDPESGKRIESGANMHDTLIVALRVEYKGTDGNVDNPKSILFPRNGQKPPVMIGVQSEGFEFFHLRMGERQITGYRPLSFDPDAAPAKSQLLAAENILNWIEPGNSKNASRAIRTGDQFYFTYYFEDPKDYRDLKFVFGDAPKISLPLNRIGWAL